MKRKVKKVMKGLQQKASKTHAQQAKLLIVGLKTVKRKILKLELKNQKVLVDVCTLTRTLKTQLELNLLLQQMLERQSQS